MRPRRQRDEVALPVLAAGTALCGVRLRPEAVAAAFRVSAASLMNRTVAAEDVFGARRARLLAQPGGLDAWIRSVQPDHRTAVAVRHDVHRLTGLTPASLVTERLSA